MTSLLHALIPSRLKNEAGDALPPPNLMSKTSTPVGLSHGELSRAGGLPGEGEAAPSAELKWGRAWGARPRWPPGRPWRLALMRSQNLVQSQAEEWIC